MYKVWHKGGSEQDKLVRLIDNDSVVSLCWVNKDGFELSSLIDFDKKDGMLIPHVCQEQFDYIVLKKNLETTIPYYKVWHDPQKAHVRLRLIEEHSVLYVGGVEKNGGLITAGRIIIFDKGIIKPMFSINDWMGIPLTPNYKPYCKKGVLI